MDRHRFELDHSGRFWLVFDASGGFVRTMPVYAGGDDPPSPDPAPDPSPDPAPAPSPAPDPQPTPTPDPTPDPQPSGGLDLTKLPSDTRAEVEKLIAEKKNLEDFKAKSEPELKRARDDAAKYRTDAQKRARTAAVKALKDAGIDVPKELEDDPEGQSNAAAQHKADVEEKDREIRRRDIRDEVRDAADKHSANFKAVYGFLLGDGQLNKLDPQSDDFKTTVDKLVQDTVKAEPSFKKGPAPSKSGADLGGGGTTDGQVKDLAEAVHKHYTG